jgi:hypothetical protein
MGPGVYGSGRRSYIHARTLPRPLGKLFLVNERYAEGLEPKSGIQSCQRRKEGNNENTIRTKEKRERDIFVQKQAKLIHTFRL